MIVLTLWLADRHVCMRVCKHGCGVKMFCFSHDNHAGMNLKKFFSWTLNNFTKHLPIPSSAETWKIFTKHAVSIFFSLNMSWHFKWEKSIFWNTSFLQNKNWLHKQDFMYKTSWLVRISLLISVITKSVTFFFSITWYKHKRGWENSLQLCKPWTSSQVCIAVSDSPIPSRAYIRPCKYREKVFYCSRSSL